jgi:type I restriction enzyme R subunit
MVLPKKHGLTDFADHDAFFDLFYDEDIRFEYILAFSALTRSLNLVFPAKEALDSSLFLYGGESGGTILRT